MNNKTPTNNLLLPSTYYHIYNRGNDKGQLFYSEDNYEYFLKKYSFYMDGYWDTYAWALMGNHFHFLVAVKSQKELTVQAVKDFKKIGRLFYNHHQRSCLYRYPNKHKLIFGKNLSSIQN